MGCILNDESNWEVGGAGELMVAAVATTLY